jgi:hypothetical protein
MTLTRAWLLATIEQAALIFVGAVALAVATAGAAGFNLSGLHAALIAGALAVASFIQSVVANALQPHQINVLTAARLRATNNQAGQLRVAAFSLRWLFAVCGIIAGIYLLVKAAGDNRFVAAGVGLILVSIGLVVP